MSEKEKRIMATMDALRPQIKEAQADIIENATNSAIQKNVALKKEWQNLRSEWLSLETDFYIPSYEMLQEEIKNEFLLAGIKEFRKKSRYADVEVVEVVERKE